MTTISEALNMRSGINVQGKVERKEEVRTVNTKAGGTVDVANAFLVDDLVKSNSHYGLMMLKTSKMVMK